MTIPVAPLAGFLGAPATRGIIENLMKGDINGAMRYVGNYAGVWGDGSFHWDTLVNNVLPIAAGVGVHKIVGGKLGFNKALGQAGVPIIRL